MTSRRVRLVSVLTLVLARIEDYALFLNNCREQANAYSIGACGQRRDLEPVVHRVAQILLAAQIPLRGLHPDVT
jgi:hypothetical protein